MKKLLLILLLVSTAAKAGVPYYKIRQEEGRKCRYNYSGEVVNGQEQLVNVQCF